MTGPAALPSLAGHLAVLSLVSFGGIPAILPDIHRLVVEADGLLTDREFADFFAISQVMPGPNFIFMLSLIGWKIAGLPGALVTAAAISGPSSTAAFVVFRLWHRFRDAPWRRVARRGLAPLTIGLVVAGGWVLAATGDIGWRGMAITAATAGLTLATRINPLWMLAAAGLAGAAGLL